MLGDIMLLCLRGGRFSQALEVLTKLEKHQNSIVGVPNIEALQFFTDMCISLNKTNEAIVRLTLSQCYSAGHQIASFKAMEGLYPLLWFVSKPTVLHYQLCYAASKIHSEANGHVVLLHHCCAVNFNFICFRT
jgi:hypothetical protein